ncbi:MAG: methylmalonyl-CoA mutase family protein [Bacteroidales bacterium]|nr:methylmalonyl-CoA mutase family protein [Bacteroidales bacterium]MDZ4203420.1 methylmalonyl-CoA mutase family protein [Bacteroidales bacterium]
MDTKDTLYRLFSEFPPVTTEQWEEKIIEDLQGADYDRNLVWKTAEGISVKPYYRTEHIRNLAQMGSTPGHYPFVRGVKTKDNSWDIRQCVDISNIMEANHIAINALANGATALSLDVSEVESATDLENLLRNIPHASTDIHFFGSRNYPTLLNLLEEVCRNNSLDLKQFCGSFDFDPISHVLLYGDFYHSESTDFDQAFDLIKVGGHLAPNLRFLSINGHHFHNSGANIVQELAFALASGSDYLALLVQKGLSADKITPHMGFILSSGSNYFMEIAKFRAVRMLWARIAEQYNPAHGGSLMAHIQAITSNWNKTVYDPYVNILRSTTETMAAAIGGVDSITVNPFDAPFKEADDFSRRIARNQQILLREESYLDKVIDPAAGSYYIEQLTAKIATHTWDLFVKVEQLGGMTEAVKKGFVQDEVDRNAGQRRQDVANRRLVLLGTNQYPNPEEQMLEKIQEELFDQEEKPSGVTIYKTLKLERAADGFEDLRLATEIFVEAGNKQPTVFLFTLGNLAMHKAREGFSSGFFGCAGYQVIDNTGFNTVKEGVKVALRLQPSIIVICSSDEEYVEIVPAICQQLKAAGSQAIIALAGYPKDHIEAYKKAGVDDFIHIRSNLQDALAGFHKKLGITDERVAQ